MRVIATDTGYDNIVVREVGEIFEMPEGSKAPWFKPVDTKDVKTGKADKTTDSLA